MKGQADLGYGSGQNKTKREQGHDGPQAEQNQAEIETGHGGARRRNSVRRANQDQGRTTAERERFAGFRTDARQNQVEVRCKAETIRNTHVTQAQRNCWRNV